MKTIKYTNLKAFREACESSASNLYTFFNAGYQVTDGAQVVINVSSEAVNADLRGTITGATNQPVKQVEPNYLPFMKKGCCYAGVLTSLAEADKELSAYQFIVLDDSKFFVWGIANATKTDFYTPDISVANSVVFDH